MIKAFYCILPKKKLTFLAVVLGIVIDYFYRSYLLIFFLPKPFDKICILICRLTLKAKRHNENIEILMLIALIATVLFFLQKETQENISEETASLDESFVEQTYDETSRDMADQKHKLIGEEVLSQLKMISFVLIVLLLLDTTVKYQGY